MRDISDLINKPKPEKAKTAAEINREQYLADLERFRDFTPDEDKIRWAAPVRPRWRN